MIDALIIKQDMKLHTVVHHTTKTIVQGRETFGTETVQGLLALYDKGSSKQIGQNKSNKLVSTIEGFTSPDSLKKEDDTFSSIQLGDKITSFSNLSYEVIEIKKLEQLIFFKGISYV